MCSDKALSNFNKMKQEIYVNNFKASGTSNANISTILKCNTKAYVISLVDILIDLLVEL